MSSLRIQLPVLNSSHQGGGARVREGGGGNPPIASDSAIGRQSLVADRSPLPHEPRLILDGEGGLELSSGQPNACALVGNPSSSTPSPTHPFTFSPSQPATSQLLEALSDPTFSLLSLARTYNTSLDALIVWMDCPDIQEKLNAIENASIRRNRLVANTRMTKVIQACEDILNGYSDEELNNPILRTDTSAIEQRRRSRETARKAAWLIFRISRCAAPPRVARLSEPGRSPPPAGDGPSLRGGGGRPPESQPDHLDTYMLAAAQRADSVKAPRVSEGPSAQTPDGASAQAATRSAPPAPIPTSQNPDDLSQARPRGSDFPALPHAAEERPPPNDREHQPSHASHASHPSHAPPPDSS